jgi:Flp pilus assembly protein TadD
MESDSMKPMDSREQTTPPSTSPTGIFQEAHKRRFILCLLLVVATIALYSPVTRAPFLNYDDAIHVSDNAHVRAGLTWSTFVWAFTTSETTDWHPITWLSHALDSQIFGVSPEGPHTVNLLLHAGNVLLLFLILERATALVWRSLMVAALFALHPINVESVAWISERKDVLSMFFFLLALAAYGWYARKPGVGRYLAVTVAYALSLMSKAQAITFPFALLLLDYWPLGRLAVPARTSPSDAMVAPGLVVPFWKLLLEKVSWFALSAASALITIKVEADATQSTLPFWIHLGNAAISYVKYIEKAFWPVNLAVVYPHPGFAISVPGAVLSALVIVVLTVLAVLFRQRRPYFVGWFWFLGTLVPMIGLVQISVHAMADRYAYIPLLGIFVIVCWGAAELAGRWHVPAAIRIAVAAVVLVTLATGLHRQVSFWSDNRTLWAHTLEITQGNYTAEDNLATALIATGKVEEAMPHFQRAISIRPDDAMATLNIATYEQMMGNYAAALEGYARVLQFTKVSSLLVNARINSGYAHYSLKQYDGAKQDFDAALSQQPNDWASYRGLGLVAQRGGDIPRAAQNYLTSVQLQPSPVGYLLLAQALQSLGQADAARAAESQAARMTRDPNDDLATVKLLLAN